MRKAAKIPVLATCRQQSRDIEVLRKQKVRPILFHPHTSWLA